MASLIRAGDTRRLSALKTGEKQKGRAPGKSGRFASLNHGLASQSRLTPDSGKLKEGGMIPAQAIAASHRITKGKQTRKIPAAKVRGTKILTPAQTTRKAHILSRCRDDPKSCTPWRARNGNTKDSVRGRIRCYEVTYCGDERYLRLDPGVTSGPPYAASESETCGRIAPG